MSLLQRVLDDLLPYEAAEEATERESISRDVDDDFDDLLDLVMAKPA